MLARSRVAGARLAELLSPSALAGGCGAALGDLSGREPSTSGAASSWDERRPYQQQQRAGFSAQRQGGLQLDLSWLGFKALVVDDAAHRALVQSAFRERKLSFGFSGGGTLYAYYIGVVGGLRDAGVLGEGVKVAGASAGSLIAACHASGLALDHVTEQCMRFMHDLRVNGVRGRMGLLLEQFLRESMPQDAHQRCTGSAYVAVTQVSPLPRLQLVSEYQDREDLIQALMASCHIPYYLDGRPYTEFRGGAAIDGGFTKFIPLVPQTVGVRVCCFPSKQVNPYYRIGISPDNFEPWPYSLAQMLHYSLNPASERFVVDFVEKGKRDAQAWMSEMGLDAELARSRAQGTGEQGTGEVAAAERAAGREARGEAATAG